MAKKIKDLVQLYKHPLAIARAVATKKIVKQFARKFDLVYFGYVDQREDEHELVRGITLSADHIDTNYSVGHFHGHDVTVVQRSDKLVFPDKPSHDYTWMILQVDLNVGGLPHVFMDANHHDETFYANLFVKFANFQTATSLFMHHDPLFTKHFKVYTPSDKFDDVAIMLTPEITSMLAYHFKHFDFEIFDDRVLVYASNALVSLHTLQDMMRVGTWLADQLNKVRVPQQL